MLDHLEILQVFNDEDALPARRGIRFAAVLAKDLGSKVSFSGCPPTEHGYGFYDINDEKEVTIDPAQWQSEAAEGVCRVVLMSTQESTTDKSDGFVYLELPGWETEHTLFAGSGIAGLLGDPEREPLVPRANFASHTIGYAVFLSLVALSTKWLNTGLYDTAYLNGVGVFCWVNWKAAVLAQYGAIIKRMGKKEEWPILPCKDGFVAFVYNLPDWEQVVEMLDSDILRSDMFSTFEGRLKNRNVYLDLAKEYFLTKTKTELDIEFLERGLPSTTVTKIEDIPTDPLFKHRECLIKRPDGIIGMRPPYRVVREEPSTLQSKVVEQQSNKPLSGFKVLDLGIITAGAGVSAILADMGAEVLKIESQQRPDGFRIWPGATTTTNAANDSPVFIATNRNKKGVAIDLKSSEGVEAFLKLTESADIIVENFRRGVLDRLGLTFDRLRQANPNILLASISSQGQDGPGSNNKTFGSSLEANSGFAALTHYDDGLPVISGRNLNYPDQIVCLYGAAMISAAVINCVKQGCARHLDISQRDCALYQAGDIIARDLSDIKVASTSSDAFLSAIVQSSDKHFIAVSIPKDKAKLLLDRKEISSEDLFSWAQNQSARVITNSAENVEGGARIVIDGNELLNDDKLWADGIFQKTPDGFFAKGFPFQLTNSYFSINRTSPAIGQHSAECLNLLEESV